MDARVKFMEHTMLLTVSETFAWSRGAWSSPNRPPWAWTSLHCRTQTAAVTFWTSHGTRTMLKCASRSSLTGALSVTCQTKGFVGVTRCRWWHCRCC